MTGMSDIEAPSVVQLAVDPGRLGGFAMSRNGGTPVTYSMPATEGDVLDLIRSLSSTGRRYAYVEEVGGFIGRHQPGAHMFTFGRNYGFLLGALQAEGWHTTLIRPQRWQRALGLGPKGPKRSDKQWKNYLKAEAQRRFPTLKVTLAVADALLILEAANLTLPSPFNPKRKEESEQEKS